VDSIGPSWKPGTIERWAEHEQMIHAAG